MTFNEILMKAFSGLSGWSSTNGAALVADFGSIESVQMQVSGVDASEFIFRTGATGTTLADTAYLALFGLLVVVNPWDDIDARDRLYSGDAEFLMPGTNNILTANGDDINKIAFVAVSNNENSAAYNTTTHVAGSIQRTATASSLATLQTVMTVLTPVSSVKAVNISLSPERNRELSNFNRDMIGYIRGVA